MCKQKFNVLVDRHLTSLHSVGWFKKYLLAHSAVIAQRFIKAKVCAKIIKGLSQFPVHNNSMNKECGVLSGSCADFTSRNSQTVGQQKLESSPYL